MSARNTGTEQSVKDTAKQISFAQCKLHATTHDIADSADTDSLRLTMLPIINSTYSTIKL